MQLGRRASLLVALSLLVSSATASAECAWVLWQQHVATNAQGETKFPLEPGIGRYSVVRAYRDQAGCEAVVARAVAVILKLGACSRRLMWNRDSRTRRRPLWMR